MNDSFGRDAEALVKRLRKSELATHIARVERQHHKDVHELHASLARANDRAKELAQEQKNLQIIRKAVQLAVNTNTSPVDDRQLSLLLRECEPGGTGDFQRRHARSLAKSMEADVEDAAEVLMRLLDRCDDLVTDMGGDDAAPTYDELRDMLDAALEERAILLARAGVTDREWSNSGGLCEADFEF